MSKSSKLYKDSPALERDAEGNMQAVRPSEKSDGAGPGEDGSDAEMQGRVFNQTSNQALQEMHDRHMQELKDMQKRHMKDMQNFSSKLQYQYPSAGVVNPDGSVTSWMPSPDGQGMMTHTEPAKTVNKDKK